MKKGFTLVELSIVLVIIGLLTAGVVGGQSLIDTSKQRNYISTLTGYGTAINAFRLEYDALPGDMTNAYDYWGTNCNSTAGTCNGNGDSIVAPVQEGTAFYKHLSLAGILPGNYSITSTATALVPGTTGGKTPFDGMVSTVRNYGPTNCLTKDQSSLVETGGIGTGANAGYANMLGFKLKTTVSIDKKIDDGVGCSGTFTGIAWGGTAYTCPAWDSAKGTAYNFASTTDNCGFIYDLY